MTLALLLNNKSPDKKEEKEDKARKKKTKTEDQKRSRTRKKNKKLAQERSTEQHTRQNHYLAAHLPTIEEIRRLTFRYSGQKESTYQDSLPPVAHSDPQAQILKFLISPSQPKTGSAKSHIFELLLLPLKALIVIKLTPASAFPDTENSKNPHQGSIFWSKTDIYSPPPLGNLYFFPKKTA